MHCSDSLGRDNYKQKRNEQKGNNRLPIWVYNVSDKSIVKDSPFYTKTDCAKTLNISRDTVRIYLNSDKVYKDKWVFSTTILSSKEFSKWEIPDKILEIITGELLGDGHIRYDPEPISRTEGRLEFTFSVKNLGYLKYLKYVALASICTDSEPSP